MEPNPKPELVIGLVGAVGTDLDTANACVRNSLSEFRYSTVEVKLSSLMHGVRGGEALNETESYEAERISAHMDAGDRIREQTELNDAMALLAIASIADYRRKKTDDREASATAFVLNSLKHPDEVQTLRFSFTATDFC